MTHATQSAKQPASAPVKKAAARSVPAAPVSAVQEHLAFQLIEEPVTAAPEEIEANSAAADAIEEASPYGVIIEDGLPAGEGQINRSEFMDDLAPVIESTADALLRPEGRTAKDCPYLTFWVDYYRKQSAAHIERAIVRYVRPQQTDLDGIRQAILAHVRDAVAAWVERRAVEVPGEIDWRVNDDHVQDAPGDGAVAQRMGSEGHGAPAAPGSAAAIRGQLDGDGTALDSGIRNRMEQSFGTSFRQVRIHTDGNAVSMARSYQAKAFTVGQDVAFGAGQYQPGTLAGDLLLAHELAHTIQQRGATVESSATDAHELDATRAALGAIFPETDLGSAPRFRSGLSLRRCGTGEEPAPEGVSEKEYADTIAELMQLYAKQAELDKSSPEQAKIDQRIRELSARVWGWGVQLSDKQLRRAVESGEDVRAKIGKPFAIDADEDTAKTSPASVVPAKDFETIDLAGIKFKASTDDSRVLLLWNKKDLYVLPARGLVYTAQPPATQTQASGPVFGVPVAGHAGAYLVKTDHGVGMMVDAGGKTSGAPEILMPTSLAYLQARMNVREIDGALLSHSHADHVSNIPTLVQQQRLGGSIYVWPGWEQATKGPMAAVWQALQDPNFTQFGKGPGWQPTQVAAQQIPGPAGTTGVTQGTMQIGSVQMDFVTSTDKLRRYVQALSAGESGTKFADAASKLVRITPIGGKFNLLVVGDLRGSDLKELHKQMGDANFRDFVKDTRVLGGIQHHLGAVNNKADVEGIRLLLKAIGPTAEPLTAVVQTGEAKNENLIKALQESGVRVVTLGEIDPAKLASVTFTTKGELRSQRASVFEAGETIRAAQQRIVSLTLAAEALEKYPDEVRTVGKTPSEIATGLRAEANRLRMLVDARQELATSKLHASTAIPNVENQLQQNERDLKRVEGAEAEVGGQIQVLARFRPRAEEIRAERQRSRQRGESSLRLRQLIAQVMPEQAQKILAEELSQESLSKRGERRARRAARARLKEQGRLSQLAEPGAPRFTGIVSPRGGVAVVLIASEILALAEPIVSQYVQEKKEAKHKDFYTFFEVASWWQERGASVPVTGLVDDKEVADAHLLSSAKRRIWTDLPKERQVPESELDDESKSAKPLEKLYIPQMIFWKDPSVVWDSFRNWVSSNVKDYDDYASEFKDVNNPAIRHIYKPGFEDWLWEIRTGKIEDGHVVDVWQFSPELTVIMQATAKRVIQGTEQKIEKEKARKGTSGVSKQTTIGPAVSSSDDDPWIGQPATALTGIGKFKASASRKVYGNYRFRETERPLWSKEDEPTFLVYGSESGPKAGYVLIGGGDYNTYQAMRSARVWTYDPEGAVKLPRPTVKSHEVVPTEPVRTPREAYAEAAKRRGEGEFVPSSGSIFYGEQRFPYYAPNESALLWVKKDDLTIEPFTPARMPAK